VMWESMSSPFFCKTPFRLETGFSVLWQFSQSRNAAALKLFPKQMRQGWKWLLLRDVRASYPFIRKRSNDNTNQGEMSCFLNALNQYFVFFWKIKICDYLHH
uniref:hypothetical protein n=1 Tax=Flavobacterium anhuiense TaxID=459526 RepID=UPI0034D95CB5